MTESVGRPPLPQADGGGDGPGESRVIVLNPVSGTGNHADVVRDLAAEYGFAVRETEGEGDAITLAREAVADGADQIGACGGDGTLNEVVRGVVAADALDEVELGVIPAGTGNNFAGNVGVTGIERAFEVLEHGERRRIDLGFAAGRGGDLSGEDTGRPFVNSCVGGLTADASAETSSELKSQLGVLAYVLNTFQRAVKFEGATLAVQTVGPVKRQWSGEAVMLLVGNGRRFPAEGRTQANMEDGLFDLTIVEERPTMNLAGEAALTRLMGADTPNITRLKASELEVTVLDKPLSFSLDGEILTAGHIRLETRHRALAFRVGPDYDPAPERQ